MHLFIQSLGIGRPHGLHAQDDGGHGRRAEGADAAADGDAEPDDDGPEQGVLEPVW